MTPRFSIFIPVWNGAHWVGGAIESVLAQIYPEWELVIGDNASSDDLKAIVARYADPRIHLHQWATHTDVCENFNRTMLLSRFEWVQPLGVDDRLAPHCRDDGPSPAGSVVPPVSRQRGVGGVAPRHLAGGSANAAYYGYRGVAQIPDGWHDAASWLRHSLSGVIPWSIGTAAFAQTLVRRCRRVGGRATPGPA
jgi:glycosyltransferase involved in cell wall biosynthesis